MADDPLFDGLGTGFRAGRYHSWVVSAEGLPDCLEVTATDRSGLIMGLRHKTCNLQGHPVPPRIGPHAAGQDDSCELDHEMQPLNELEP